MTERPGMFEVEPLSERRWSEIEHGVLDRIQGETGVAPSVAPNVAPRGGRRGIAAALVLAAAAGAIGWILVRPPAAPRLATSRVTTEDAPAHTGAGDVAIEVAARSSVLVLERAPDEWLVSIEHGSARFRVPPRGARPAFAVEAGEVRVEVVGTRFEVAREAGARSAGVRVEEGTVRVIARGESVLVGAGEAWPIARAEAEVTPAAHGRHEGEAAVVPQEANERSREPDATTPHRSGPARTALERRSEPDEASPTAPPTPTVPPARERFAHAASLEASAPDDALAAYQEIEREGGTWGANALYARARLELERGRPERARPLLERYLAEHPRGLNAEDARDLLSRTR